jgi:hypothetical protein
VIKNENNQRKLAWKIKSQEVVSKKKPGTGNGIAPEEEILDVSWRVLS